MQVPRQIQDEVNNFFEQTGQEWVHLETLVDLLTEKELTFQAEEFIRSNPSDTLLIPEV